jgi:hypothetical protein
MTLTIRIFPFLPFETKQEKFPVFLGKFNDFSGDYSVTPYFDFILKFAQH